MTEEKVEDGERGRSRQSPFHPIKQKLLSRQNMLDKLCSVFNLLLQRDFLLSKDTSFWQHHGCLLIINKRSPRPSHFQGFDHHRPPATFYNDNDPMWWWVLGLSAATTIIVVGVVPWQCRWNVWPNFSHVLAITPRSLPYMIDRRSVFNGSVRWFWGNRRQKGENWNGMWKGILLAQGDDDVLMFDRARRGGRVVFVYYPFCTLQLGLSSNVQWPCQGWLAGCADSMLLALFEALLCLLVWWGCRALRFAISVVLLDMLHLGAYRHLFR